MIFRVDNGKDFFEINPGALAFEWMSKCSSREAKWITLVYDYKSPLRNIPVEQRKYTAAKIAGFLSEGGTDRLDKNARNVITGKIEKVNNAIKEFIDTQYDEEQEMLAAYTEEISQALEMLKKKNKTDKEWGICDKLNKTLPNIVSAKKELEMVLGFRKESSSDSMGDETTSAIDLLHEED